MSNKILYRGRGDTGGNDAVIRVKTVDDTLSQAAIELPTWCLK